MTHTSFLPLNSNNQTTYHIQLFLNKLITHNELPFFQGGKKQQILLRLQEMWFHQDISMSLKHVPWRSILTQNLHL